MRREKKNMDPRLVSLMWSTPFMIFLALPLIAAFRVGWSTPVGLKILIPTVVLALVYILSWLVNSPAPIADVRIGTFGVTTTVILVTQLVMFTLWYFEGTGASAIYNLCYLMAPLALQAPRRWVLPSLAAGLLLAGAQSLLASEQGLFPFLAVTATTVVTLMARISLNNEALKEVEAQQEVALSQERERTRISADLHDILGQSLTGITVKADLAGRLIDTGRLEEARSQIDELTEMARTALADVRDVVAANRTLLPDTEIDSARAVLQAAGVRMVVLREGEPAPGTPSTLVAHAIREGCTNALRHASPTEVRVTLRCDGVKVVNDGVRLGRGLKVFSTGRSGEGGNGLAGLRERVGSRGQVTWGHEGDQWILDLTVAG